MENDNLQTLSNQLGWCITTRDALKDFEDACVIAANNVDNILGIMRNSTFTECSRPLEKVYPDFQEATKALYRRIHDVNAPYIQKEIGKLVKVINKKL